MKILAMAIILLLVVWANAGSEGKLVRVTAWDFQEPIVTPWATYSHISDFNIGSNGINCTRMTFKGLKPIEHCYGGDHASH